MVVRGTYPQRFTPRAQTLAVDASTVFRAIQRMEKRLGIRLCECACSDYPLSALAQELA